MSKKSEIHRAHGPFVATMMEDIKLAKQAKYDRVFQTNIDKGVPVEKAEKQAKSSADKIFNELSDMVEKNSRSFGKDLVSNMNNAKEAIEKENVWVEGRIISDQKLLEEHIKGPSPDDDYIGELQYRISSNTQKITDNKLRLSQIETKLKELLNGGSKKRSKKYRKSNKKTQRRRVRKNKTRRTRI